MAERKLFADTDEAAERVLIEGYRRLSGAQKVRKVDELSACVKRMAYANLRRQHPDEPPGWIKYRLAQQLLPEPLARLFRPTDQT